MQTFCYCETPLGRMLLAAEARGLTGAWFCGQRYYARGLAGDAAAGQTAVLEQAEQ